MLLLTVLLVARALAQDATLTSQAQAILQKRCISCHGATNGASKLSMVSLASMIQGGSRMGPALVPGNPRQSAIIRFISGEEKPRMPLSADPLPADEIQTLSSWIASMPAQTSAATKEWWSFQKPVKRAPPTVKKVSWVRNSIDNFILANLESKGLTASADAPRVMLIRRLYFDLAGIPPAFEEVRRFVEDAAPDAYEKLVDRLLASPAFGERWGRHWLDLARYADTQGFEADRENYHMWRYRDYVIRAFNTDKPYNRFVQEQLAGDEIPNGGEDATVATSFLRLGPRFQSTMAQQLRQMTLDEITGTVGSVFLGVTVKCAQCHDHKYDPIPQKDFYRLQAFFSAIEMVEPRVDFADKKRREWAAQSHKSALVQLREAQARFDEYQRWMLEKLKASGVNVPEQGTVPVAAPSADEINTESYNRKLTPAVFELERRITRAIANGVVTNPDDKIFTTEEKEKYLKLLFDVDGNRGGRDMGVYQRAFRRFEPVAHAVRNMPNDPNRPFLPVTFVRIKGEFDQPGEWVKPGVLSAAGGSGDSLLPSDQFGNVRGWRTPLAAWIGSAENPLSSRVMVNRIWQYLFGSGIVATSSDFGRNGARPTHPELLDHLAVQFVENKWSVKSMIRLIVTSSAYRQTSIRSSAAEEKEDPANTLLWRQNRRRLEGDVLRDHLLAVGGSLNDDPGGPGTFIPMPAALKERMTIKNIPSWMPATGPEIYRRSIYVFQRRQLEVPFLAAFDAPVLQFSCERRVSSTTALQALTLMNDTLTVEQAGLIASAVKEKAAAFERILLRAPTPNELDQSADLGLESLCRTLLNTNEFLYVD